MMVRICHYPSTWRSWNGQIKHGRFCPLPNFPRKLNFTIFTGPILRQLIVFGNASTSFLYDAMVSSEMEFIKCSKNDLVHVGINSSFENMWSLLYLTTILQLWNWGEACLRSATATWSWGHYICKPNIFF